ncbi:hypothetical protein AC622_07630 [Bacillus sp. FJAT-27916]|uniref:hypothetical protein n=1 Tax=Bacillaceae TaxID=186817 RepID=UPI0006713A73|nr:hypothetical protein [Bacillus sp. FJAT-27916]KMY44137.1 hypothetical protein AC622_07630 [Bacillus sp. FJAT-27916]
MISYAKRFFIVFLLAICISLLFLAGRQTETAQKSDGAAAEKDGVTWESYPEFYLMGKSTNARSS